MPAPEIIYGCDVVKRRLGGHRGRIRNWQRDLHFNAQKAGIGRKRGLSRWQAETIYASRNEAEGEAMWGEETDGRIRQMRPRAIQLPETK